MANSVITDKAKQKMVKARAGDIVLPAIKKMAFGDGATNTDGSPIAPSGADIALKHELLKKDIDSHTYPTATSCRYSCRVSKTELIGKKISEIALIDSAGDIVAIKTFTSKTKDDDMEMVFEIEDQF